MSVLMSLALTVACLAPAADKPANQNQGDGKKPAVRNPTEMFASSEDGIYARLNLTPEQLKALQANNVATAKRYEAIRTKFREDGDLWAKVRAYDETAKASKAETKRIMTKEQHALYIRIWDEMMAPYIANSQKMQGSSRGNPVPKPKQ